MGIFREWAWSFLGITIESLPFVVIGALISGIIQVYLSEDTIRRFLPKNKVVGLVAAACTGLILPMCECAIVPVTRSLIKKGLPVSVAITFMLSVPIVNPLVIMSTYYSFPNNISVVVIRTIAGAIGAIIVGAIIGVIYGKKQTNEIIKEDILQSGCSCCGDNQYDPNRKSIVNLINHASKEFLNISVYVIIGALISSIFGIIINEDIIKQFHFGGINSILIMMGLSFILSLCSEADAFVAKGFLNNFGVAAVSSFLLLGPMMDLKNFILTLGLFKRRFSYILLGIISSIVFGIAMAINLFIVGAA